MESPTSVIQPPHSKSRTTKASNAMTSPMANSNLNSSAASPLVNTTPSSVQRLPPAPKGSNVNSHNARNSLAAGASKRQQNSKNGLKSDEPRLIVQHDGNELDLTPVRLLPSVSVTRTRTAKEHSSPSMSATSDSESNLKPSSASQHSFSLLDEFSDVSFSDASHKDLHKISAGDISDDEAPATTPLTTTATTGTNGTSTSPIPLDRDIRDMDATEKDTNAFLKNVKRGLSEKELDELVTVELHETNTLTLLYLPSLTIHTEDVQLHKTITEKNAAYKKFLDDKQSKDIYASRGSQTFNAPVKDKEIQAAPPATKDFGVTATVWDIYDTYDEQDEDSASSQANNSRVSSASSSSTSSSSTQTAHSSSSSSYHGNNRSSSNFHSSSQTSSSFTSSSSHVSIGVGNDDDDDFFGDSGKKGVVDAKAIQAQAQQILGSSSFKKATEVLERAITQNELHDRHLMYRDHPIIYKFPRSDDDEASSSKLDTTHNSHFESSHHDSSSPQPSDYNDERDSSVPIYAGHNFNAPGLSHLWTFSCAETKGRNVSGMDWNKLNNDLLATAYGQFDFGNRASGLICLWTLKNPSYPEKIIHVRKGVTCLDFCSEHPHLLAAGMYDGSVAIYDIREAGDKPALESAYATGKHSESVMDLKWVTKGSERSSVLTSISTDGNVKQWNMKKGLVPNSIMTLKRIPNQAQSTGLAKSDGIISRTASGLCFDFPSNDNTQYLAGTEDGIIHKCSVSYNEQVLENFFGHTGPVYKLRSSPFLPDAFLSCSADWTCKLWSQKDSRPVLSFQSGFDYVTDINWSPFNSTVFGSVSRDGRVEVWDLDQSTLDPFIRYQFADKSLSTVAFGRNAPVLLTGATDGSVDLFRLSGTEDRSPWSAEQQARSLQETMFADIESRTK